MKVEAVLVLLHEFIQNGGNGDKLYHFIKAANLEKHFFLIKKGGQMCEYQARIHPALVKRQNFIRERIL